MYSLTSVQWRSYSSQPENYMKQLQATDGLVEHVQAMAAKVGLTDMHVSTRLYHPPGTLWRLKMEEAVKAGDSVFDARNKLVAEESKFIHVDLLGPIANSSTSSQPSALATVSGEEGKGSTSAEPEANEVRRETPDSDDDVVVVDGETHSMKDGNAVASHPFSPPCSVTAKFLLAKWCSEEGVETLPAAEAIRLIRAKHASLLSKRVWARTCGGSLVQASLVQLEDGRSIRLFHVSHLPRMDLKKYSSTRRFFVDLAATLLYSSAVVTKTQKLVLLARAIDGVCFLRDEQNEASSVRFR